jgi:NAD(P)-dependent dehydrogenase (short-subunit alcohol dehydrogenase family)
MDSRSLEGHGALVTGGSRGMGRAIALALAGMGARVVFSYRKDVDAAHQVVAEIEALGGSATALPADLREPGSAAELARRAVDAIGPISTVVSNAGMASRGHSVTSTSRDEYLDMLQMHAFAIVEIAGELLPAMRAAGSGSIVLVSSTVTTALPANTAPYAVAKSAGEAIVRVLAMEERGNGIRVNAVAPGLVATDMGERLVRASVEGSLGELDADYPFGRVCRPEDVAHAVSFLVDPDSYVTGHRLVVDGGGPAVPLY